MDVYVSELSCGSFWGVSRRKLKQEVLYKKSDVFAEQITPRKDSIASEDAIKELQDKNLESSPIENELRSNKSRGSSGSRRSRKSKSKANTFSQKAEEAVTKDAIDQTKKRIEDIIPDVLQDIEM